MRYIGIDYGSKRIGLALSDESGTLGFAHSVVSPKEAVAVVLDLVKKENAGMIVLGKSHDLNNKPNPIMQKIEKFKTELEQAGLTVVYESEVMTSAQAARAWGGEHRPVASPGKQAGKQSGLDASAAALILQSYLNKKRTETS